MITFCINYCLDYVTLYFVKEEINFTTPVAKYNKITRESNKTFKHIDTEKPTLEYKTHTNKD